MATVCISLCAARVEAVSDDDERHCMQYRLEVGR